MKTLKKNGKNKWQMTYLPLENTDIMGNTETHYKNH